MARKPKPRWSLILPEAVSLGIDPGQDSGAAVWRIGDTVLAAAVWLRMRRKGGDVYRLKTACKDRKDVQEAPTLPGVLSVLPSYLPPCEHLTLEGQFHAPDRARGKKRPRRQADQFTLARSAGVAWACLAPKVEPLVALHAEWAPTIGAGGVEAKHAEAIAWEYSYRHFAWPGLLGPWLDDITTAEAGAVGESAVMAGIRRIE